MIPMKGVGKLTSHYSSRDLRRSNVYGLMFARMTYKIQAINV